jgi:hypothetical protein
MSIPLDRLYHYINNIAKDVFDSSVIIYRFSPHGSKNIKDLTPLTQNSWVDYTSSLHIICNDQEPLHWELYDCSAPGSSNWNQLLLKNSLTPWKNNFSKPVNIYDQNILLHSEQRSDQCTQYQENNFILAYYWSHAIIALDWFRFAKHVAQQKRINKTFLIYNRAWAGTREYRLKFLEHIVNANLNEHCQTSVNSIDPELKIHYNLYKFKNSIWQPTLLLEQYFSPTNISSHYSADFSLEDYENTNIEVVLETLFDDSRLHLTEKSLRPIACGQPFILAATHGSLEYLRSYGFKTYSSVWNEDYDLIKDPADRLNAIVDLMSVIAKWDKETQNSKLLQAQQIADYNKNYFFSQDFFRLINDELTQNLKTALHTAHSTNTGQQWINWRCKLSTVNELKDVLTGKAPHPDCNELPEYYSSFTRENIAKVMLLAKTFYDLSMTGVQSGPGSTPRY